MYSHHLRKNSGYFPVENKKKWGKAASLTLSEEGLKGWRSGDVQRVADKNGVREKREHNAVERVGQT